MQMVLFSNWITGYHKCTHVLLLSSMSPLNNILSLLNKLWSVCVQLTECNRNRARFNYCTQKINKTTLYALSSILQTFPLNKTNMGMDKQLLRKFYLKLGSFNQKFNCVMGNSNHCSIILLVWWTILLSPWHARRMSVHMSLLLNLKQVEFPKNHTVSSSTPSPLNGRRIINMENVQNNVIFPIHQHKFC